MEIHIPTFPKDLIPPVEGRSFIDEITPLNSLVAPIDPIPTINALDSLQQELPCPPTLALWDEFLLAIAQLFMESHIEDVGDILDDIHLLFQEIFSSIAIVNNSCTSTQQGICHLLVLALDGDFLIDILGFLVESHIIDLEDFFYDIQLLFDEENPSIVVMRSHFYPHVH